jgi:hypothetical protein
MNPTELSRNLARRQKLAFGIAIFSAIPALLCWVQNPEQFYQSYLIGYLYWIGPSLGALGFVCLHNLTGGAWGFAIRRLLEAAMRNLPLMALLFLPLFVGGIQHLYIWADPEVVAHDALIQKKAAFLNVGFFRVRSLIYFAFWILGSGVLLKLSARFDRQPTERIKQRIMLYSGLGILGYFMTMSFAAFDWGMSLEPHWFSTIYGVLFIIGQGLTTLCLAVVVSSHLAKHEPFSRWLSKAHFHDLGNLIMAFTLLWAYMTFSQFQIIWSANLPEETPWYLNRIGDGWQALALFLVAFHFVLPLIVLLRRQSKRKIQFLAKIAIFILFMRYAEIYWLIAPAFNEGGAHFHYMDVIAPLGLGSLWIGMFLRNLRGRPLVSLQDGQLLSQLEAPLK